MPAVSNTSRLILLTKINRLELLRDLFEHVAIPTAVLQEIHGHGADDEAVRSILSANWIEVHQVADPVRESHLLQGIDEGEAAAIGLAISLGGTFPILIDDLAARRYASKRQLRVTGTGGVLVGAKDEGLIPAVQPDLDRLRAVGMRISTQASTQILTLAGGRESES